MPDPKDPDLLSQHEAAAFLRVDLAQLRAWVREEKLPLTIRGGRRVFHRSDLERFGGQARELAAARAANRLLALFVPKLKMLLVWRNGKERKIHPAEWPEDETP